MNAVLAARLPRARRTVAVLCGALLFVCAAIAHAANADIGVVVLHGKWGSPEGPAKPLANALEREGFSVVAPEMAWSRRRSYDRTVEETDAQVDAAIEQLKSRGAKRIFLVGHSLGAAYALHYAARADLAGVVAVAPGHRPENPRLAQAQADDVRKARELVAAGKPAEVISFTDFNTGNRRDRINAGAAAYLSYFDPEGPMNMARNVAAVKATTPVLWLVPTREEAGIRDGDMLVYKRLPPNPATQLAEPQSDHLQAPAASIAIIVEWMRRVAP
jgi:pimeloyl-ACP methyl ester carboxylesterase